MCIYLWRRRISLTNLLLCSNHLCLISLVQNTLYIKSICIESIIFFIFWDFFNICGWQLDISVRHVLISALIPRMRTYPEKKASLLMVLIVNLLCCRFVSYAPCISRIVCCPFPKKKLLNVCELSSEQESHRGTWQCSQYFI